MQGLRVFAATMITLVGFAGTAPAQQAAPPPAVLVQAAELQPLAARSECIGRVAAVDKVERSEEHTSELQSH